MQRKDNHPMNKGRMREHMVTERKQLFNRSSRGANTAARREIEAAMDALESTREAGIIKRTEVMEEYGSMAAYKKALAENTFVIDSASPENIKLIEALHEHLLTPLIPIDDERATIPDLVDIVSQNSPDSETGNIIRDKIGKWKEVWIVTLDPKTKKPIAAGNTSMYTAKGKESEAHVHGTANNIYLLVDKEYRKLGLGNFIMEQRKKVVEDFLAEDYPHVPKDKLRYVMFNEQNDPSKMTLHDYFFDTQGAGIDQCVRQMVFGKAFGNKTLSFDYVQLALDENSAPVEGLFYNAFLQGVPKDDPLVTKGLPSAVVRENLECFFTQSVKMGDDFHEDPAWVKQRDTLTSRETIEWAKEFDFKAYKKQVWDLAISVANGEATDGNRMKSRRIYNERAIGEDLDPADFVKGVKKFEPFGKKPRKIIHHEKGHL